ncbi:unnamed protein product [Discula destructiva]
MGGKVFAAGCKPLYTPRMIPEVYRLALRQSIQALEPLFPSLKSPLEAPEKPSFGDVDILLSLDGAAFTQTELSDPKKNAVWAAINTALRAVRAFQGKNVFDSQSFAVAWPDAGKNAWRRQLAFNQEVACEAESEDKAEYKATDSDEVGRLWWYIQVDVRLCNNNHELEWRAFKHDHGDMWNILGTIIRPYGLTASEDGLHIRIPEIERLDKKKARVFLTDCPVKVRKFLISGNQEQWTKRFASVKNMFAYAARCKGYHHWLVCESERLKDQDGNVNNATAAAAAVKETLKSNDRQRMRTRQLFARWFDEHVPAQLADLQPATAAQTHETPTVDELRAEFRAAAFKTFPGAEERYAQQLIEWNKEKMRILVKNTLIRQDRALPESVASALPAPQEGSTAAGVERDWRGTLRSALVKIIVDDDADAAFVDADGERIVPPRLRDEHGVFVVDDVKKWIGENWERVGRAAWAEQCVRSAEAVRLREESRLQQEALQRVKEEEEEEEERRR